MTAEHPYHKYRRIAERWNIDKDLELRSKLNAREAILLLLIAAEVTGDDVRTVELASEYEAIREHLEKAKNGV